MRPLVATGLVAFRALALAIAMCAALPAAAQAPTTGGVLLTDINGAIGVATARQLARAIDQARKERATALLVRLDTPGGLVSA
ncbi:MAG: hypothetical protein WBW74_07600, partial [Xanthobacteraceae bacterium]